MGEGGRRVAAAPPVAIVALGVGLPLIVTGCGGASVAVSRSSGRSEPVPFISHAALPAGRTPAQVRAFWTRARMREAKPVPLRRQGPRGIRTPPPQAGVPPPEGPPTFVPPDAPGGGVPRLRPGIVRGGTERLAPQPHATVPYERYEVPDTTSFPARVHGKVFFEDEREESLWACSATVVTTSVQKIVFTAAHCIYTPGKGWSRNWLFIPGYRDGSMPYGAYIGTRLVIPTKWYHDLNFAFDMAAVEMSRPLEMNVGAQGIAFNQPRQQLFRSWGYPAAPPFNGERLFVCASNYGFDDPNPPAAGPPPMGIGCDMTTGSSGGGWMIADRWLNSLNSFGYRGLPEVMFGPYFGDEALGLYNYVCCGTNRTHNLTVNRSGSGAGSITSVPGGINCPPGCSSSYDHGAWVTLIATPSGSSSFAGWNGCDAESGMACKMYVDADRTVAATFSGKGGARPNTRIARVIVKSAKRLAKLGFTGSGGHGARHFLCKIDKKRFAACTSPKTYRHMKVGRHTFKVKAVDSTGRADPTPAAKTFRIRG